MADLSELELIRAAQSGDAGAFGRLYERYADPVYVFIYYKTHHRETAEDLTSRVFLKALEHVDSLTPAEQAFRPWIYTIARNTVIDHYRTRRDHADISDAWDLAGDDDIPRDAELRMRLATVQEYLKQLDPVQRDIVLLRVWQDLPYDQIAAIVGKTPENCKVIFSRVVRRMRADLAVLLAMAIIRLHL
ncbi:MAG: sigma-70 family RNA polymerase sigma factor [Candidatus Yanofskybacteria bacterium]|nr:sigma-70 family RNA polymerase sigma factor [Candidatus Yanofskybacteria bacterium]